MERDVLIGIDASLVNCGVAVYSGGNLTLYKGELFEAVDWIRAQGIKDRSIVVIEDPNKDRTAFGLWGKMKEVCVKWKRGQAYDAEVESVFRMGSKQAQNVGESKAAAKVLIKLFERANIPVVTIAPSDRHRADKDSIRVKAGVKALSMPTKTTAKQFEDLTGYNGRSNEHNRDAATLVYGKTTTWALMMLKKK